MGSVTLRYCRLMHLFRLRGSCLPTTKLTWRTKDREGGKGRGGGGEGAGRGEDIPVRDTELGAALAPSGNEVNGCLKHCNEQI